MKSVAKFKNYLLMVSGFFMLLLSTTGIIINILKLGGPDAISLKIWVFLVSLFMTGISLIQMAYGIKSKDKIRHEFNGKLDQYRGILRLLETETSSLMAVTDQSDKMIWANEMFKKVFHLSKVAGIHWQEIYDRYVTPNHENANLKGAIKISTSPLDDFVIKSKIDNINSCRIIEIFTLKSYLSEVASHQKIYSVLLNTHEEEKICLQQFVEEWQYKASPLLGGLMLHCNFGSQIPLTLKVGPVSLMNSMLNVIKAIAFCMGRKNLKNKKIYLNIDQNFNRYEFKFVILDLIIEKEDLDCSISVSGKSMSDYFLQAEEELQDYKGSVIVKKVKGEVIKTVIELIVYEKDIKPVQMRKENKNKQDHFV